MSAEEAKEYGLIDNVMTHRGERDRAVQPAAGHGDLVAGVGEPTCRNSISQADSFARDTHCRLFLQ